MTSYSIVVPAFNSRPLLQLQLRCLEAQEFPSDRLEYIVVDDGSTDDTFAWLREYSGGLHVTPIRCPQKAGRSHARNVGVRGSSGDIVIFLDSDMLPDSRWLSGYAEALSLQPCEVISGERRCISVNCSNAEAPQWFAKLTGAPREGLFTGNVSEQFSSIRAKSVLGQYPHSAFAKLESQLRIICNSFPRSPVCAYSFVTSNVAVRRSALNRAGEFDVFLAAQEDTDLGLRLLEAGARFGFAAGATAYHIYRPRWNGSVVSSAGQMAFFYRHPYEAVLAMYLWYLSEIGDSTCAAHRSVLPSPMDIAGGQLTLRDGRHFEDIPQLRRLAAVVDCRYTEEQVADYFREITGITASEVRSYLALASRAGLITVERCGRKYFDIFHASNWLRYNTPFESFALLNNSYARICRTDYQRTGDPACLAFTRWAGEYEVRIDLSGFRQPAEDVVLCVPLPVNTAHQDAVKITEIHPEDVAAYLHGETGMVRAYPLSRCSTDEFRLWYRFECDVHEAHVDSARETARCAAIDSGYTECTLTGAYLERAMLLLRRIRADLDYSPTAIARRIYDWLCDNTRYYETPYPDVLFLETGLGSCIHRSRAFINLCRLMNIPAREWCGSPLSNDSRNPDGSLRLQTISRSHSPLTHTWAEFYDDARGWVPVDFIGWGYGKRILTLANVVDPSLARAIRSDTALFDNYYFGSLDPFRIHASDEANKLPSCPATQVAGRWQLVDSLLAATRHTLTCNLVHSENVRIADSLWSMAAAGAHDNIFIQ